ncbi:MAG: S53 family peptidase [Thermoplasmata archaeon]
MSIGTALPGSFRDVPEGARRVREADLAERTEVTIYLRRRGSSKAVTSLPAFGSGHPAVRQYVERSAFGESFGAGDEDISIVSETLTRSGLTIIDTDPRRRSIRASGTVGMLNRTFGVALGQYEGRRGEFRGREGELQLPPELGGRVVGVFGLDNRPQVRTHFRIANVTATAYLPTRVGTAYAFPPAENGAGQCIGLLEFGGGFRGSDLQSFFASVGLTSPTITTVSVDGATNAPTGDPNGPDVEVELDIEVAGGLAPGARIVVYFAPNNDQGFLDALTTAIHDSVNRPAVLSISWGGPETTWTGQARSLFEQACEDATAMGITVIAAAGDSGASDGGPAGTLAVDFPASAPYVLGCGGTRLILSGDSITEEVVWNDLSDGEGATGGGVSQFFPRPTYQSKAGVPAGDGGFVGRGVPDVAGDADPETGYAVFVDGNPMVIGGTSAVAPLWAGLLSRINQGLGVPVGFLQPLIYADREEGNFHDILQGNNGGFDAGPGWDTCTGLGSPDGVALLAALTRK